MREELEGVKARLRRNREFAELTVSRDGQNLTSFTNLTATEIAEAVREARLVLSGQRTSNGIKTYRNEEAGIEIDVPEEWLLAPIPSGSPKDSFQFGCLDEAFNFEIGPLFPERLLEYTELEFRLYAQNKGYTDLEFGRIMVGGREHVWARYHIQDMMGNRWNKKYIIVFGGTEYTITATCNDPQWLAQREKDWDAIVKSFRLMKSREQAVRAQKARRRDVAGPLYEKAYEAVAEGHYSEARVLLERCLRDNPDHILAHKELAVVLRQLGDVRGALSHRMEVKRLDPSDTLNRVNISALLEVLGARDKALREIEELLVMQPNNREFQALKARLGDNPFNLTYPQHYDEESRQQPGKKRNLKLTSSIIPDFPYVTHLLLLYHWEGDLPDEEARHLALRAIAYICCAIYDVAIDAGLFCQPSPIPNGRRPAWIIEGEKSPVSLILSDIDESERTCQMTIGAMLTSIREPPSDRTRWEKLHAAFKARFSDICV